MEFIHKAAFRRGFTLIELAVVLVIIGLLIAGSLIGRSMLRQSQVMSVMSDAKFYINAALAFQQKYNALPGDMANATTYWGAAGGGTGDNYTVSCYTATGTGTQTCNGDGNGQIAEGIPNSSYTYIDEEFRAWQHLANAGLITGQFSGVAGSGGIADGVPGANIPRGRLDNSGFSMAYDGAITGNSNYYDGNYGNTLTISGRNSAAGAATNPILTTAETLSLDTKFDDGLPGTGTIVVPPPAALASCASSATAYNIAATGNQCYIIMKTGF